MAHISPLAEALILAGNLRAHHTQQQHLGTLVAVLQSLHVPRYHLVSFEVAISGGSVLTRFNRDTLTAFAIDHKGQYFDLHSKRLRFVAENAATARYPGIAPWSSKVLGKPKPIAPPRLDEQADATRKMLEVGREWLSQKHAKALENHTPKAAPTAGSSRKRL